MQRPAFFTSKRKKRGKKKGASVGGSSMLETLSSTSDVWVMWQKEEIPAGSPAGRCLRRAAPVHESDHDCKWSFASFSNKVRHTSQETQCPCHLKKKKERKVQSKSPDLWGAYMRTKNIAKCRDQKSQAISWNPFENPGRGAVFIVGKETVPSCRG